MSTFSCHFTVQKYVCSPAYFCIVIRFQSFQSHPYLTRVMGVFPSPAPTPPKATQTFHQLDCALLSPLPIKRRMNSDTSTLVAAHAPGETEQRQSSPGTSVTWLCPMYPKYLHLPPTTTSCTLDTALFPSLGIQCSFTSFYLFARVGVFLHRSLIFNLSTCSSRSYLRFKMQLKHNFLQEVFQVLYSSLISFSKSPVNTICYFATYFHKTFVTDP